MDVIGCDSGTARMMEQYICGRLPDGYDRKKDQHISQPGWCFKGDSSIRRLDSPYAAMQAMYMHEYAMKAPKY